MKILSIETSCDETGISIIEVKGTKNPTFKILADSLNSQIKIHAQYGGVFPALAKREHQKNLPILLERTLKKTKLEKNKNPFDLIAVTSGPGLEPALWTGIVFAKELSKKWNVPLVPVNHMEGHILSVFGKHKKTFKISKIKFPALSLLVSGGHTELVLFDNLGKYKIIGETLDDAAGEAFDKVARILRKRPALLPACASLPSSRDRASSSSIASVEEILFSSSILSIFIFSSFMTIPLILQVL